MAVQRYSSSRTQTLDKLMQRITRPAKRKRGFAEERILMEWATIVGPALAQYTVPQKMTFEKNQQTGGRLYILAEPAWAMELQYMEPVVLDKIAGFFGYRAVSRLIIKQGPVVHKQTKATKPKICTENKPLPELPSDVEDDELRNALQKLARMVYDSSKS